MKKSRFTNEQIAFALKQAATGTPVEENCRKLGNSQQTFYRWKKKFGDMGVTELITSLLEAKEERQLSRNRFAAVRGVGLVASSQAITDAAAGDQARGGAGPRVGRWFRSRRGAITTH